MLYHFHLRLLKHLSDAVESIQSHPFTVTDEAFAVSARRTYLIVFHEQSEAVTLTTHMLCAPVNLQVDVAPQGCKQPSTLCTSNLKHMWVWLSVVLLETHLAVKNMWWVFLCTLGLHSNSEFIWKKRGTIACGLHLCPFRLQNSWISGLIQFSCWKRGINLSFPLFIFPGSMTSSYRRLSHVIPIYFILGTVMTDFLMPRYASPIFHYSYCIDFLISFLQRWSTEIWKRDAFEMFPEYGCPSWHFLSIAPRCW